MGIMLSRKWKKLTSVFPLFLMLCSWGCQQPTSEVSEDAIAISPSFPSEPFPFSITRTMAIYPAEDSVSAYVWSNSDVIEVIVKLPKEEVANFETSIERVAGNSILHSRGPGVAAYVLPAGPSRPLPTTNDYTQRKAVSGIIRVQNLPARGSLEYKRPIILSLDQVDFGDGKRFSLSPVNLTIDVSPP